jgi:hypothetical protein
LTGVVDYLYSLIKGEGIRVDLPERRQHPRDDLLRDEESADEIYESKDIRILNISKGGMRLHTMTELKVGSVFRTELNSSRYGVIPLKGEVIWSRPKDQGEGYIVGVHFSSMDEDVLKTLKSTLDEFES